MNKNRIIKFLKYTSQILNIDYQALKDIVNTAARGEFVRVTNQIRNDKNRPLFVPLTSLSRNLRYRNIMPEYRIQLYIDTLSYIVLQYLSNLTT